MIAAAAELDSSPEAVLTTLGREKELRMKLGIPSHINIDLLLDEDNPENRYLYRNNKWAGHKEIIDELRKLQVTRNVVSKKVDLRSHIQKYQVLLEIKSILGNKTDEKRFKKINRLLSENTKLFQDQPDLIVNMHNIIVKPHGDFFNDILRRIKLLPALVLDPNKDRNKALIDNISNIIKQYSLYDVDRSTFITAFQNFSDIRDINLITKIYDYLREINKIKTDLSLWNSSIDYSWKQCHTHKPMASDELVPIQLHLLPYNATELKKLEDKINNDIFAFFPQVGQSAFELLNLNVAAISLRSITTGEKSPLSNEEEDHKTSYILPLYLYTWAPLFHESLMVNSQTLNACRDYKDELQARLITEAKRDKALARQFVGSNGIFLFNKMIAEYEKPEDNSVKIYANKHPYFSDTMKRYISIKNDLLPILENTSENPIVTSDKFKGEFEKLKPNFAAPKEDNPAKRFLKRIANAFSRRLLGYKLFESNDDKFSVTMTSIFTPNKRAREDDESNIDKVAPKKPKSN